MGICWHPLKRIARDHSFFINTSPVCSKEGFCTYQQSIPLFMVDTMVIQFCMCDRIWENHWYVHNNNKLHLKTVGKNYTSFCHLAGQWINAPKEILGMTCSKISVSYPHWGGFLSYGHLFTLQWLKKLWQPCFQDSSTFWNTETCLGETIPW